LDEPTASLTPQEIDELMQIIDNLTKDGKSVILITHKLKEIKACSDTCTVIRQGKYIKTVNVADVNENEMAAMMVGRDVNFKVEKKDITPGEVVLDIKDLHAKDYRDVEILRGLNLNVRKGEIVGLCGVDGNGQTELIYGLSGLEPLKSGKIVLKGDDVSKESIRRKSILGMSHIPEDRHKHGLVLDYSLEDNLVLVKYFEPRFKNSFGILKRKEIREYAYKLIREYDVRSGEGPATLTRAMSGGNQQKAIIAREIDKDPDILIAVQPTRGVDIGAIEFIHKQLIAERDAGKAVLLVSLELDEVMDVPDRILVMYEGEIVGEFKPEDVTMEELGLYMTGAKRQEVTRK
jgi:simple sugar transport system ATP-binding protein